MWGLILLSFLGLSDSKELGRGDHSTKLYYHLPPDPVNVRTLNYYFPMEDHLVLPCTMPIQVNIAYNSYSGDQSIFGEKWTFNHNIRVTKGQNRLEVLEGDGFQNSYFREKNFEAVRDAEVDQILIAQKKADSQSGGLKSDSAYEELKRKLKGDQQARDELLSKYNVSKPLTPGLYYSFSRGPSTLEMKADGSFLRKFQNGAQEFFDKDGRMSRSEDRNGNHLSYAYQDQNLVRINDMCGRSVNFTYQTDPAMKGLIAKLVDSTGREISYQFEKGSRRLGGYLDFTKRKMEFAYDKKGNMTRVKSTRPDKPTDTIELDYNDKFEVKEQRGPGSKITKYKRTFVANNINHSITEIQKLDGSRLEGREVHEFKLREFERVSKFNGSGKEISKETKTLSSTTGYPTTILDAQGQGEKYDYDAQTGNLIRKESIPGGDVMVMSYDARCNQIKEIQSEKKGQSKTVMKFSFDPKCNLIQVEEMTGAKKTVQINVEHMKNGKVAFIRDRINAKELAFTYWVYGKPESITLKDAGTLLVKYSNFGEILDVETFPHGKGKDRFKGRTATEYQSVILGEVRGALDSMLNYLRPGGLNIGL